MQLALPQPDGSLRSYVLQNPASPYANVKAGPLNRTVYAAEPVVVDRRLRDPWDSAGSGLGRHTRVPRTPLALGLQDCRSHGHGPARHGRRLAECTGTDPAQPRPREDHPWGGPRVRRRHRPVDPDAEDNARRRYGSLRRADRNGRVGRRSNHPDGEPRTRRRCAQCRGLPASHGDRCASAAER